ncbi:hypothetical protein [Pedobacter mucosus]|uniref:hypothetical protein n=1 Tax=Pedobacter mucosus TaxID=2895286 RepID=UPI001EE431E2|nr:hypothetical protein [Pedobacter mucosus]UKT64948.1 hypothetical protein LOK61_04040 [Pedobacter mucosus]
MKIILTTFFCILTSVTFSQNKNEGILLFQSGFEKGTKLVKSNAQSDILIGVDNSVAAPNDWTRFSKKDGYPIAGEFRIFYEGGDSTKRKSALVPDPKNPKNTVLKFSVFESNAVKKETDEVAYKTRIQGQVNNVSEGIQRYYQSVRMYFPSTTMDLLKKYPEQINWYSLAEFWNNAAWGNVPKDPYRLTVGMGHKPGTENPFYFHFSCDKYRIQFKADGKTPEKYIPTDIKNANNETFNIPSDTWITVEYYFQEGNWKATTTRPAGHFYMTVQADGGKKIVLFNERVATIHPNATQPDGLTVYHPMKFYTNKQIADYMKANHTPMEILWDDLKIYSNKIPNDDALQVELAKP